MDRACHDQLRPSCPFTILVKISNYADSRLAHLGGENVKTHIRAGVAPCAEAPDWSTLAWHASIHGLMHAKLYTTLIGQSPMECEAVTYRPVIVGRLGA
jgi:hypothetical protein